MTHVNDGSVPVKRTRDPKGTRERLIRAALDLFTTQGYHASTTPQIAARAGIAEGTIYRHFKSKEQLLNEIFRAAVLLLQGPIGESTTEGSCRRRLEKIASEWRSIASSTPPLITLVFRTDVKGLLDTQSQEAFDGLVVELETLFAAGKSAGEVRAGSARVWANVWMRLMVLVLERTASGAWPHDHPAPEQVLDGAWEAIRAR